MGVDVTIDAITESYYAPVAVTLLVSFMLLMGVILLNLLIAIMSDKIVKSKLKNAHQLTTIEPA